MKEKQRQVKRPYDEFKIDGKDRPFNEYSLSPAQVAALLGVSSSTVRHYSQIGVLPVRVLPSGFRLYAEEDVRELANRLKPSI